MLGLDRIGAAKSVAMRPVEIALARTLEGPYSTARLPASCASAGFVEAWIPIITLPRSPEVDDIKIAAPALRAAIFGSTGSHSCTTLAALSFNRRHCPDLMSNAFNAALRAVR